MTNTLWLFMNKKMENLDFSKGYGQNKIVLMTVSPEMLFAYWEISKEKQEEARDRKGNLVLRLIDLDAITFNYINIEMCGFLGSYYLNQQHGVRQDRKYSADIGIKQDNNYDLLTPASNVAKTPSDRISNDTSCEFYDPVTEALEKERLGKEEKKRSLELIQRAEEQLKKDKKSSETFHNYFVK